MIVSASSLIDAAIVSKPTGPPSLNPVDALHQQPILAVDKSRRPGQFRRPAVISGVIRAFGGSPTSRGLSVEHPRPHASATHDATGPTVPRAVRDGAGNRGGVTFVTTDGNDSPMPLALVTALFVR